MHTNLKKITAKFLIVLLIAPQLLFIGVPRAHGQGFDTGSVSGVSGGIDLTPGTFGGVGAGSAAGGGGAGAVASVGGGLAGTGLGGFGSTIGGIFGFLEEVPTSDRVVRATQLSQVSKERVEDTLMWALLNLVIEFMVADIVNWINTGFQGEPAFVTSPETFFSNVVEQATGFFIEELGVAELCNARWLPWFRISLTIPDPYLVRARCTLSDIISNADVAFEDFTNLGWEGLVSVSANRQNNPYGAYLIALDERNKRRESAASNEASKLNWSGGFLSTAEALCTNFTQGECTAFRGSITLPGTTIEEQLNQALELPKGRLRVADEIDEIIGALLSQLVIGIFQGGLRAFGR